MTPLVRTVQEDELPAYLDAMTTAFLERPDVDKIAADVRTLWDLSRAWAAFEGHRVAGTFRSWATAITVPGGMQLPAAAVAAVTVLPTHRRRGVLRSMAAAEHAAARERGEAIAALYASEYPIYGRFGYGPATRNAIWAVDTLATRFHAPASGSVEMATPSDELIETLKDVFDAWRAGQHGEIRRLDYRWRFELGLRPAVWGPDWKGFVALHRDGDGAIDGYVRYRTEDKWENRQPRNVIHVNELHALNHAAYDALWRFLVEMDLIAMVRAEGRRIAERLPWLLTNHRAATASEMGDALWVKLLDVPQSLAARTYEREGELVLEVRDAEAGSGERYHLKAGPDGATCRPTDAAPDLTLDAGAVGAAYLGGTRLSDAVLARGADEHRPGALADADALFRTADEPWCSTFF